MRLVFGGEGRGGEGGRTEGSVDLDALDAVFLSISRDRHVEVMDVQKMQRWVCGWFK